MPDNNNPISNIIAIKLLFLLFYSKIYEEFLLFNWTKYEKILDFTIGIYYSLNNEEWNKNNFYWRWWLGIHETDLEAILYGNRSAGI